LVALYRTSCSAPLLLLLLLVVVMVVVAGVPLLIIMATVTANRVVHLRLKSK
jgi:hypothetical protein